MILETERLILRPWEDGDAENLYEYAKSPLVGPVAGWPPHTSVDESLTIIRTVFAEDEIYAVCLREDNMAVGCIGLIPTRDFQVEIDDDEIEIGYWIGVPFWGRGLITEAVKKIQEHAFLDLGYSAIWGGYYDGNNRSMMVLDNCGFIYQHTAIGVPCIPMQDIRTEHFTRITKEEWLEIYPPYS